MIKVKDLIATLQQFDPELPVVCSDYYYDIHEGYSSSESANFEIIDVQAPRDNEIHSRNVEHWSEEEKVEYGPLVKALLMGRK